jgi:hypothetical protein
MKGRDHTKERDVNGRAMMKVISKKNMVLGFDKYEVAPYV